MEKERVLIIKTGYSEILDVENHLKKVSLGDVLRSTTLLHLYAKDNVTWLTDKAAYPLLEQNKYINRLLPLDFENAMHLLDEEFDILINLEKNIDICKFANKVDAWNKKGFRFDKSAGKTKAFDNALDILSLSVSPHLKKSNLQTAQKLLFKVVGKEWDGEEYVLGYKPNNGEIYDIGLNTQIGPKWPIKSWPKKNWDRLEKLLKGDGFKVSRQDDKKHKEITTDLNKYMDWINSCKLIVTNDSLGMHLGIALKKKVLGLFGPTPHKEVYFYERGKALLPEQSQKYKKCIPCFDIKCNEEKQCMESIFPETVYKEVKKIY
ncbi:glycosyl transferase [Candidatus Pacearchaeota archaeon]|jgi:heptosyltransferase-2|nr:glycosyl transferase [Candidatus Pacearchaeota archaeon]|tara:strand:+ start:23615 stop:24574 length:960 start_codon:yes stop_codon:yes gene_type:complete